MTRSKILKVDLLKFCKN